MQLRLRQTCIESRSSGKERDAETGLDYFGARYFSAAQGRFMGVDPSMESVVLQNPQSWNRYSYTINNPLHYIDPNGELWIDSGDKNDPYSWVDECQDDQTCYGAAAAVVGKSLRVYGSGSEDDITNYKANKNGNIDLNDLAENNDSNFDVKSDAHSYLSLKNAAAFFNTAEQYGEAYPDDKPLFVTDAGKANGANFPPHKTHGQGRSADIRYMDENGNPLQGKNAATDADDDRISTLVDIAKDNGFNQNYSARPKDFGTQYAPGHDNHLHLGTTKPVVKKATPPNK
jgi:RHS repeat-associated protein